MPRLMIRCPKTDRPVPVGIETTQAAFDSNDFREMSFGPCPECGERHTWNKEDAYVEEGES